MYSVGTKHRASNTVTLYAFPVATQFTSPAVSVAPGRPVLSLSTQHQRGSERVQVLALCPGPKDPQDGGGGGSLFHLLSLSLKELSGILPN